MHVSDYVAFTGLILYDQNAFKMQRMNVLTYGSLLCKMTWTHLLTFSSVCNYIKTVT